MIGLFLAYTAGKSVQRSRSRRQELPTGYGTFEFLVIMTWFFLVGFWPVHFGYWFIKKGMHWIWASLLATFVGVLSLLIGATWYIVIGLIYATTWIAIFVGEGVQAEEEVAMYCHCCCDRCCECD